ncbi:hypothetical protein A6F68_00029 [Tsuneonella dongtanensis]|uniref:DUF4136 domain-containing protein n=1 Tax=Tsuneonella dongtanensis TaxID=692370 RepID=A0A1B2A928_9SPHN|nr:hypothetical protein [Tsuneonella dongtanensis]ANY18565.1 hypothetical protein A6F68_00029 [Tsuneonella dongtanensis]
MMKAFLPLAALALAVPAAATDVAVTRFHNAESLASAAPGPIAVRAGAGLEAGTLETQIWLDAVAGALTRQGFTVVADAPRVAMVSLDQEVVRSEAARSRTGVSVGVGVGSGGGWYGRRRSGVDLGVGLGINLGGGRSGEVLDSRLGVTIVGEGGAHAWEGRAEASPRAKSKDAQTRALAGEMADRLFSGFPGESGATIGAR